MTPATQPRLKTLWPLPGGAGFYLESLARLIEIVEVSATTEVAVAAVVMSFDSVSSAKAAGSYLHVAASLGLLTLDGSFCEVTHEGTAFLATRSRRRIARLLTQRIAGVTELLELLEQQPRRIGLLHREMNRLGFTWTRDTQVRYRLRWLEEVGVVRREGRARPVYRLARARAAASSVRRAGS